MVFDNLMNPFLEVKWQRLEVKGGVVIVRGKQLQWLSPNPPALPPKKVRYFVKDHKLVAMIQTNGKVSKPQVFQISSQ